MQSAHVQFTAEELVWSKDSADICEPAAAFSRIWSDFTALQKLQDT